ncbi:type II toxin-antitoxin system HipA family toxin [Cyclonatronum proteinivorum]|uniref:type II toxin-antitoxin system HipA family toxin n=1 Tax=Cyclonatronum proteinivorum TaxID=1457365 RepID=UPI0038CC164E
MLDPDLQWYSGPQYPLESNPNFGLFLDSMPDTWGRTLMKKREAILKQKSERKNRLDDTDFLLGVYDEARMGGFRFKTDEDGPFLGFDKANAIPPITDVRELQSGAQLVESDDDSEEVRKWLRILLAPGSSLGGARPKSSVKDENGELWIAKFPSRQDTSDVGAWEYIAWILAKKAGISVPEARVEKVTGQHHTFFTKRFDRERGTRIHFASAMTLTGHFEAEIRDKKPSYLELAECIQYNCVNPLEDLKELWRRIVFNVAISNTDDHLRNHAFLLDENGWRLSPAYDMNPSVDKSGLALNIDLFRNSLDFELVRSIGSYFSLSNKDMKLIMEEVTEAVEGWKTEAVNLGIPRAQLSIMEPAFQTPLS